MRQAAITLRDPSDWAHGRYLKGWITVMVE